MPVMFSATAGGLSGAVSAFSGILGAIGAAQAAAQQAAVAKANARIAAQNAKDAAVAGREAAMFQDRRNRAAMAEQLGAEGASGVLVGSPSFTRARQSLAAVAKQEAFSIVEGADRRSRNYRQQSRMYKMQSGIYSTQAGFGLLGGIVRGTASLIGSARPVMNNAWAQNWYAPRYV